MDKYFTIAFSFKLGFLLFITSATYSSFLAAYQSLVTYFIVKRQMNKLEGMFDVGIDRFSPRGNQ